mmetsp:Transcript_53222/g.169002  ORF Transcript_53222/g.169002 Transcript_53222/m.169002 type:complete len:184 (+) Transcript_53222:861-1412(+)
MKTVPDPQISEEMEIPEDWSVASDSSGTSEGGAEGGAEGGVEACTAHPLWSGAGEFWHQKASGGRAGEGPEAAPSEGGRAEGGRAQPSVAFEFLGSRHKAWRSSGAPRPSLAAAAPDSGAVTRTQARRLPPGPPARLAAVAAGKRRPASAVGGACRPPRAAADPLWSGGDAFDWCPTGVWQRR